MVSFDSVLGICPKAAYYPEYDPHGGHYGETFDGIRALAYDGVELEGKKTRVFAHMGFPENGDGPVPAVVLVHGGGGHPEDVWIRRWNRRGYAAIAMDTTGFFPQYPIGHLYEGCAEGMERKLCPPFWEEGYVTAPDNSGMGDGQKPIEDQWMYHAVAQVILAHNLLRADGRIDKSKIGLCGISWGGVISSIVMGFDHRFAFAIPIYGSGYLGYGLSDLDKLFHNPAAYPWLAENRFHLVNMPVMWLCWNDDNCFSVHSNSLSYLATWENNGNTCLSIKENMLHSHYHGYTPPESYWFADRIVSGRAVPRVSAAYEGERVRFSCSEPVSAARLFFLHAPLAYVTREKYGTKSSFPSEEWKTMALDPAAGEAALPEGAAACYVEFALDEGVALCTPYVEIQRAGAGGKEN